MLKLLVNLLIIAAIIGFAFYRLYKAFQTGKQGKCAACDYDCEIKKQIAKRKV